MTTLATLCTIIRDGKILLQRKSEGRFGEGKWNGPGGKLRSGESPRDGVIREVYEETGLRINSLKLHGSLNHYFGEGGKPDWKVYQFSSDNFEGEPKESEEGVLRWFFFDEIPYHEMWQDDEFWLPLILEGKVFDGEFYFNQDASELLCHSISITE